TYSRLRFSSTIESIPSRCRRCASRSPAGPAPTIPTWVRASMACGEHNHSAVQGLMQDFPLTLPLVFRRAAGPGSGREVVTAPDRRSTWGETADRSLRLARVLDRLGVGRGECAGSFAWNTHRHLELYLGVPCS